MSAPFSYPLENFVLDIGVPSQHPPSPSLPSSSRFGFPPPALGLGSDGLQCSRLMPSVPLVQQRHVTEAGSVSLKLRNLLH